MIQPSVTFNVLLSKYNPITEEISPTLKEVYKNYNEEILNSFKDYYRAKNSNKPVEKIGEFFAILDTKLKDFNDVGIVDGWRKFYKTQPSTVKSVATKLNPKMTFLGKNLPSLKVVSMGNIMSGPVLPPVNTPDSKAPINFVDLGAQVPTYILSNLSQLSTTLGALDNKNITSVLDGFSTADKPHGGNLVPDSKHVERMGKVVSKYTREVLKSAGDAASFLIKSINFNPFGVENNDVVSSPIALESKVGDKATVLDPNGLDIVKKSKTPLKDLISPKLG